MLKHKAITLDNMIRIYGETEGKIKYENYIKLQRNFYSKISKELFDKIKEKLPHIDFKYADTEFGLYDTINHKYNKYDFTDVKNKLIIEFNGEHFHAKSPDDKNFSNPFNPSLTAAEQYKIDENKKLCAERNGYKIYYIWENEYKNNKELVIEKCLKFLENK